MIRDQLNSAVELGLLRPLDHHFACRMADVLQRDEPLLQLAAALVSQQVGEGHVCLSLDTAASLPLFQAELAHGRLSAPSSAVWRQALENCHPVVGQPSTWAPLILDGNRLYLARYWDFENTLATALDIRLRQHPTPAPDSTLRNRLDDWFPPASADGQIDWQRVAAAVALLRPFCIISGGPGTGKTRTVAAILALLVEQAQDVRLRIALAAPTGKAAARLTEAVRQELKSARFLARPRLIEQIPQEAMTLHRLLGFRPGRVNPRHGRDHPLHLDVLVVDEASMVDLPLMARLFSALPKPCRLILLGDKDQLSSVEAGLVLHDLCGAGQPHRYSDNFCAALKQHCGITLPGAPQAPGMADHIVVLQKNWRFAEGSGIHALAQAINHADAPRIGAILNNQAIQDVSLHPLRDLHTRIKTILVPQFKRLMASASPQEALATLNETRILCAVREGPWGVVELNRRVTEALREQRIIQPQGDFYPGRPVMVTINDYTQRLFNGDIGLVWPDPASGGALRVFFATTEGLRSILPARLPPHETLYAMTVHKSQGSEFRRLLLVLPDQESRVLTREWLYTAITRASQEVMLFADAARLHEAIHNPVRRFSGLHERLWVSRDAQ